jgi:hypothetical protein
MRSVASLYVRPQADQALRSDHRRRGQDGDKDRRDRPLTVRKGRRSLPRHERPVHIA